MVLHGAPTAAPPGGPSAAASRRARTRRPRARQSRRLTLASQPAAVAQGRRAVHEALRAWKLEAVADTVVLLASELLTNAVQATVAAAAAPGGRQLALTLQRVGPAVLLEVWDPSPGPAIPQSPGLSDERGRGLLLVEALARAWGQRAAGGGKVVWCEISLPSRCRQGVSSAE